MKKVQLVLAVSLCGFGGILLIAGFCCPPLGEIHHSVLIAFGEILTFSGSLIGIDYHYRYKKQPLIFIYFCSSERAYFCFKK